jgi:outer membrane protein OmpA-like peptidoglycan-associated protein
MHSHATSDNFGNPQLLQVLGDTNLGLKGFMPRQPDNIFAFGALGDLRLLNGSGSVGINTANISFRALGTVDLTNRQDPQQRIPIRLHANVGYLFENSSSIIDGTEKARGRRVSRIERFGLDINRVDTVFLGIGAEYVHPFVQPFAEWSIDIPSNRQGYTCKPSQTAQGDSCLKIGSGFGTTPSRLSFGLRATPWIKGFNATLALDVGTGATSKFIEELSPQLPWNLYFGIGFTYDTLLTATPAPVANTAPQVVQLPPLPEHHIVGVVIDEKTLQPIPNAIIKFPGRTLTGLVSRADGSFETGNLDYGDYSMAVTAEGYKDAACTATVSAAATQPAGATPTTNAAPGFGVDPNNPNGATGTQPQGANAWNNPSAQQPGTGATATPGTPGAGTQGASITSVQCVLKPAPVVGIIQGTLVDAEASSPVAGARITVRDSRGREVEVQTDDSGNFRFENVPAGVVHLSVDANGYLPSATDLEVKQKGEQRASLTLNKRPKKPSVTIVGKELKLTTQVHFGTNSSNVLPDSQALLQEVAALLTQHAEVRKVEIQGHTDDTGGAAHNKRLARTERKQCVLP